MHRKPGFGLMEDFSKSGKLPFAVMPSSNIKYAWRYSPAFYLSTLPCTVVVLTTQMFVFGPQKSTYEISTHIHHFQALTCSILATLSISEFLFLRWWWCFQVLQCSSEFHSWLEYRWVLTGTHHDENRSGHFHNFTLFPFF